MLQKSKSSFEIFKISIQGSSNYILIWKQAILQVNDSNLRLGSWMPQSCRSVQIKKRTDKWLFFGAILLYLFLCQYLFLDGACLLDELIKACLRLFLASFCLINEYLRKLKIKVFHDIKNLRVLFQHVLLRHALKIIQIVVQIVLLYCILNELVLFQLKSMDPCGVRESTFLLLSLLEFQFKKISLLAP